MHYCPSCHRRNQIHKATLSQRWVAHSSPATCERKGMFCRALHCRHWEYPCCPRRCTSWKLPQRKPRRHPTRFCVSGRRSKSDSSLTSFSKTTGTLVIVTTTGIISKVEYNSLSVAKKASKATDCGLAKNTWIINRSSATSPCLASTAKAIRLPTLFLVSTANVKQISNLQQGNLKCKVVALGED